MTLHPAVAAVRRGVRGDLTDLSAGDTVVVACSGGADSLALLSATVFEAHKRGVRVVGATIDHGLQADSAEHAAHVVGQMAALGVDETVSARVRVEGIGSGPEAAARRARYAVLGQIADRMQAAVVLLGHTRDDQAETVLLGLTRGSGGRSLAGMRRGYDCYRRPLLDLSRDETITACQVEGIEFWTDPHNRDPGFTRVRVRERVLPVLEEELGPGIAAALARTADLLRDDMEFLDSLADHTYAEVAVDGGLDVTILRERPRPVRTRVLRRAAVDAGALDAELFHVHVTAMKQLLERRGAEIQLPGHVTAYRDGDLLRFRPTAVES
ncbi:MAG: tRNA lysidine(34) synthetase TilS [Actinomycetota bacterium]|nr:tRNA lysidine(34) synthetase TilS [Actinomycetota bacterium]